MSYYTCIPFKMTGEGGYVILHLCRMQDNWKKDKCRGKNATIWQGIYSGNAILASFFYLFLSLLTDYGFDLKFYKISQSSY